jgi:hypothetical protein
MNPGANDVVAFLEYLKQQQDKFRSGTSRGRDKFLTDTNVRFALKIQLFSGLPV